MLKRILVSSLGILLAAFVIGESLRQIRKPRSMAGSSTTSNSSISSRSPAEQPRVHQNWLKDVSDEWGIHFVQAVGPLGTHFMPEINGSGGALLDYDNDGDLDLFLVNLGRSPKSTVGFDATVDTSNRLYRQEAVGRFSDQTEACGLLKAPREDLTQLGIGCAVGDINNDGFSDLYVTNYGPDQLLVNDQGQRFVDRTEAAQLGCAEWGTAAAFFDYDRDGWLDLLVVNYCADKKFGHSIACGFSDGSVSYCGPHKFEATVDRLYHNEGEQSFIDGVPQFKDVTEAAGLASVLSYGLGVSVCDFNGDLWPDFFIANDMRENRLWMNQRDGTFREEAVLRGVAMSGEGMAQGCMGVTAADVDRDADFDLLVTNLVTEGSVLYVNDGSGTFTDESRTFDLINRTKQHTGWGVSLVDLDLDGMLDLPVVNGFVVPGGSMFPPHGEDQFQDRTVPAASPEIFFAPYKDRNLLLMNSGRKFIDASFDAGDFSKANASTRALITGDIDQDGDVDLVTTSVGGRARLYRNDIPRKGHWLKVSCWLPTENRLAIGAVVRAYAGNKRWTSQLMPSSSYLASNAPEVHLGLGATSRIDHFEVIWPNGAAERFEGSDVDRYVKLESGRGTAIEQ